jgi:hypothetical protein
MATNKHHTQITMKRDPQPDSPRVYDIGLDRYGKITRAGPQQSLVRFDDGVERIIPNQHLRACDVSGDENCAISRPLDHALAFFVRSKP